MENWKTGTVVALARQIVLTRDVSVSPILADAMQDAGYDGDLSELRACQVFNRNPDSAAVGRIVAGILEVRFDPIPGIDERSGRLRVRKVDAETAAEDAAFQAIVKGRANLVRLGGTVANSYGYRAETEGVLAAAVYDADINVVRFTFWACQIAANKATARGVCAAFGFGDLRDRRVGNERRRAAQESLYAELSTAVATTSL